MNYKLIKDEEQLQKFVDFLPDLKANEGYFIILIARKKWFKESNIPSAHKLKRETIGKDKIINTIRQWEIEEGTYLSNDIKIPIMNLGVYIGYNPKNQYNACFELINQCLAAIRSNRENINAKSMANDVIQGCNGTKNFIDIDVDVKEGENFIEIKDFITSILKEEYLTFIKTNGGFHCLVRLNSLQGNSMWYQQIQKHPFKSELNIMSNDLIPVVGCIQGIFTPHFINI